MILFLITWGFIGLFLLGLHWADVWTRRTASKHYDDHESDRW